MLRVDGLGKRYGPKWVFRGINFELQKGHALIVQGRNGAGKSTLLRCISGLTSSTEGKVKLNSSDPRVGLGMAALDMHLYSHLTVEEHLQFAADVRGCDARVDEVLSIVGLQERKQQLACELSSGMSARLKMGLAIQSRPEVLMLDEPGASLDEQGRHQLDVICAEQLARGCLLVATNDPQERRLGNLSLELGA